MNTTTPPTAARSGRRDPHGAHGSRWGRWLIGLAAFALLLIALLGGLALFGAEALRAFDLPLAVTIDGVEQARVDLASWPLAQRVMLALALLVGLPLLAAMLLLGLGLMLGVLLLAFGLPLFALLAMGAVLLAPVALVVLALVWLMRRGKSPAAPAMHA